MFDTLKLTALVTGIALAVTGQVKAESLTQTLLDVRFPPRQIDIVEVGDFHFLPGQVAPLHNHKAPAIGFVAKGSIIYQIAGHKPQILNEGDAFYEPVGPSILRFDNASASEEAIFVDYNFQQKGEPFIEFEEPPKESIDRRALDPVAMNGQTISQVSVLSSEVDAGDKLALDSGSGQFGYVAEGVVEFIWDGSAPLRVAAGANFELPRTSEIMIVNASDVAPARVITFSTQ